MDTPAAVVVVDLEAMLEGRDLADERYLGALWADQLIHHLSEVGSLVE